MRNRNSRGNGGFGQNYHGGMQGTGKKGNKQNTLLIVIISMICVLFVTLCVLAGLMIHEYNHTYGYGNGGGGGGGGGGSAVAGAMVDNEDRDRILANIAKMNGGTLPEITLDDNGVPVFIDGKFSEVVVQNYSTAIMAINEIKGLMQMTNPAAEYTGSEIYDMGDRRIFKLRQVVSGVPVYDKELIIETDNEGKTLALCCDYDPGIDISTVAKVEKKEAEDLVIEKSEGYSRIYKDELCVYDLADEPVLVWSIDAGTGHIPEKRYFVSAVDKTIISAIDLFDYEEANGVDQNGRSRVFDVTKTDDGYSMVDEARGISVYKCNGTRNGTVVKSAHNQWTDTAVVSAAANIREIYDYYKNSLCPSAFRKDHLVSIDVLTAYRRHSSVTSNAMCVMRDNGAAIMFGDGNGYVKGMDIAAHEFTHAVIRSTCDLTPLNESGAINEAYCDIMGVLIRNVRTNSNEWRMGVELTSGAKRSVSNPNRSRQPAKLGSMYVKDYCMKRHDHTVEGCDNGGIHTNSGILCRAAFLMYKNGISDYDELLRILGRSMDYLVPTSDYRTTRAAILHAARELGADNDKLGIISEAFRTVGIENNSDLTYDETSDSGSEGIGSIAGRVSSAGARIPIPGAQIISEAMNGTDREKSTTTNADGVFSQDMEAGMYRVRVSKNGYRTCIINSVMIPVGEVTNLEDTILLTEVSGNPLSMASGQITDAVTGSPVKGATVHFMTDWGNTSGDYVKDPDGNMIELVTDDQGAFYTDKLVYGYYTGEVTMPGYATQHVNLVASTDGIISSSQNVILAPQTSGNDYRVTLEWGSLPSDLDAHIKGDLPSVFHVFYSSDTATYNGMTIAKLDHDDRNGNGFETITFTVSEDGTYNYFVNNYSGDGSLGSSNAKVKLYRGNVMVDQYNVPTTQEPGGFWNVFKIEKNKVIVINEITDTEP